MNQVYCWVRPTFTSHRYYSLHQRRVQEIISHAPFDQYNENTGMPRKPPKWKKSQHPYQMESQEHQVSNLFCIKDMTTKASTRMKVNIIFSCEIQMQG